MISWLEAWVTKGKIIGPKAIIRGRFTRPKAVMKEKFIGPEAMLKGTEQSEAELSEPTDYQRQIYQKQLW